MKRHFIILFSLFVFYGYSQERVNPAIEKYISKSAPLTVAKLWTFQEVTNRWVGVPNSINKDLTNFISIRLSTIKNNSNLYYVFIIVVWRGRYEYPEIDLNYYNYKLTSAFAYTEEDINRLKKINIDETIDLRESGSADDYLDRGTENYFLIKLKNNINIDSKDIVRESSFIFKRCLSEGRDVIRFHLPFYEYYDLTFDKSYFEVPRGEFNKLFVAI